RSCRLVLLRPHRSLRCGDRIMLLDSRESRKRIASFQGLRHGNLAISSQQSRQKTTLAQWVRNSSRATKFFAFVASVAAVSFGSTASLAQQPPPQSPNMTFFITSSGPGKGADLGGLEGADRQCQTLAQAAGAGNKTWRAYLSTQATGGAQAVNARDRIGHGPWQNFKGEVIAQNVDDLHGD